MHTHFLKNSLPFKEYESPNFFFNSSVSLSNKMSSYNFDSNFGYSYISDEFEAQIERAYD